MIRSLLATLVSMSAITAAEAKLPGPLVDADWLAANRGSVLMLDVRVDSRTFLMEGQNAGSALVPWSEVPADKIEEGEPLEDMLPTAEQFTALMRRSGVCSESSIVMASSGLDANDVLTATRLQQAAALLRPRRRRRPGWRRRSLGRS